MSHLYSTIPCVFDTMLVLTQHPMLNKMSFITIMQISSFAYTKKLEMHNFTIKRYVWGI